MNDTASILVTGGAGFVGSHFARLARDAGRRVVILDDLSGGPPSTTHGGPLIEGDIGDPDLVAQIIREHHVTSVAHFAGKIQVGESVTDPQLYFDINVTRTLALLATMRHAGVRNCLFSSTAAVYGTPDHVPILETAARVPVNAYGATKLTIEFALAAWEQAYGLRWAALRYFNAAGAHPDGTMRERHEPETHLIPLAIDAGLGRRPPLTIFGDDYPTPDGTGIRDYIHVQDLARAHLLALAKIEAGSVVGAVNLGTGAGFSVRAVIDATSKCLGRPVPFSIGPRRAGDPAELVADPTRAKEILDWQPRCSDLATVVADAARSRQAA